jgi:DNA helicase-2/ATP-dependent DNA helicase PcrA
MGTEAVKVEEHDALAGLTEAQREAAMHLDGPLLVLAGPGSGKTRVITHRIAYLLSQGIPAWSILALTFTNKAAGQMKQRVETMLEGTGHDAARLTVMTFHAFCARLLRRHAEAAGISPRFSIYDTADQREAMKRAIGEANLSTQNWTPGAMLSAVSAAKNQLIDAEAYAARAGDFAAKSIAKVYRAYERIMAAASALDFDDLLLKTARLLRDSAAVRGQLQKRYQYVLIDEYQDTNHAQFVIAQMLAPPPAGNICVVGDPDQSIYAFRGADIRNILEFQEHYPTAKVIPLGRNFRSTGHIVAAAAGLIRHNKRRKHKDLSTELGEGEKVRVVQAADEHHEAQIVLDLFRARRESGGAWKDMAVLYRINALSRVMEETLRDAQVPYVIARGTAFYERKEVKDALAYLRLIVNPNDDVSLSRIVNVPARGIGSTTMGRLETWAAGRGLPLLEAMRRAGQVEGIGPKAVKAMGSFTAMIDRCRDAAAADTGDPAAGRAPDLAGLVERVVRESGLEAMYAKSKTDEDAERLENIEELISAAAQFTPPVVEEENREAASGLDVLAAYLESVALVSDADAIDPESGAVTLMTLHAAKGLEYDTVAIIGVEEGILPHSRSVMEERAVEEERRLCFVGMTRARRRLMMSSASVRTHRGMSQSTIPSHFLGELPEGAIERVDETAGATGAGGLTYEPLDEDGGDDGTAEWGRASTDAARDRRHAAASGLAREFPVGTLVRHPRFGVGRIESIGRQGQATRARVMFASAGTKTLILEYANLTRAR